MVKNSLKAEYCIYIYKICMYYLVHFFDLNSNLRINCSKYNNTKVFNRPGLREKFVKSIRSFNCKF